MRSGYEG
jgi:hypothetical protein